MNQPKIKLRKGNIHDIPEIMLLVKELAIFEKAEKEMVATTDMYEQALNENIYDIMVATIDGTITGMMLYYYGFSTWKGKMLYLEDFVVSAAHRSIGIGQVLFDQLTTVAKENNCALMKWQVIDWNEGAIKFYKKQEASIETEWYNCKLII